MKKFVGVLMVAALLLTMLVVNPVDVYAGYAPNQYLGTEWVLKYVSNQETHERLDYGATFENPWGWEFDLTVTEGLFTATFDKISVPVS